MIFVMVPPPLGRAVALQSPQVYVRSHDLLLSAVCCAPAKRGHAGDQVPSCRNRARWCVEVARNKLLGNALFRKVVCGSDAKGLRLLPDFVQVPLCRTHANAAERAREVVFVCRAEREVRRG